MQDGVREREIMRIEIKRGMRSGKGRMRRTNLTKKLEDVSNSGLHKARDGIN